MAPELFGGATVPTALTLVGLSAFALGAAWAADLPMPRSRATWVTLAAAGWTLLQRVPLPRAWLEWTTPRRVEEVAATAALFGDGSLDWIPLTLDPGGTVLALTTALAVCCSWLLGGSLARAFGRRTVYRLIAFSALALGTVAWMHFVSGSREVFGFYSPTYSAPRPVAPLMNPNHLAGFMGMGAILCLGLGVSTDVREQRVLWVAGAVLCGVLLPLSMSRSGVLGFSVSLVLFAAASTRRRGRGARLTAVAGACVILLGGAYLGFSDIAAKFVSADYSKLTVALESLQIALAFPIAGVGRGAFSPVYGQMSGTTVRFDHPENLFAQWATEWGFPLTLALIGILAWALFRAYRTRFETASAVAALVGLVCHDFVDFTLEMPGIVIVASGLAGAILMERRIRLPRSVAAVVAATTIASVVWAIATDAQEPGAAGRLARDRAAEGMSVDVRGMVRDHPLEPSLVLLEAWSIDARREPDTGRWINRAMQLAPLWPGPHLLAARSLWRSGHRSQAALEAREAEDRRANSSLGDVCAWLLSGADVGYALSAAPRDGPRAAAFYDAVAGCIGPTHPATTALDHRIRQLAPRAAGPLVRAAASGLDEDRVPTLESAWRMARDPEDRLRVGLLLADALAGADRLEDAAEVLDQLSDLQDEPTWMQARLRVAIRRRDEETATSILGRLRGRAGGSAAALARVHILEATMRREAGSLNRALAALEEAQRISPDPSTLRTIAGVASAAGLEARSQRALERLCRETGLEADCARVSSQP